MKDHGNGRQFMRFRICRESAGDHSERFFGNYGRAPFPALVGMLVHVTVITGEVAPAVELQDELLQFHPPKASGTGGGV